PFPSARGVSTPTPPDAAANHQTHRGYSAAAQNSDPPHRQIPSADNYVDCPDRPDAMNKSPAPESPAIATAQAAAAPAKIPDSLDGGKSSAPPAARSPSSARASC